MKVRECTNRHNCNPNYIHLRKVSVAWSPLSHINIKTSRARELCARINIEFSSFRKRKNNVDIDRAVMLETVLNVLICVYVEHV